MAFTISLNAYSIPSCSPHSFDGVVYGDGKSDPCLFSNRKVINCEQPRRFLEMYYLTEVAHDDSVQCGNHMGHFHRSSDYPFDGGHVDLSTTQRSSVTAGRACGDPSHLF